VHQTDTPASGAKTESEFRHLPPLEAARILASVGEAPYAWHIASDVLIWGDNARAVIGIVDLARISSGRNFAQLLADEGGQTRFDAITQSTLSDNGEGVPYTVQYCLRADAGQNLWLEDIGRWFAGADGKPARAHGVVRAINERHEREERLTYLSSFDDATGEMNRWGLMQQLQEAFADAERFHGSCGFLLIAVDDVARINESYGFDVADDVIAAVARRLRSKMRGVDKLGRFSGNKFGVVLTKCTAEEIAVAAERLLAGVRGDVFQTKVGPVAATITLGGVIAPRHARSINEILARAQESLDAAKVRRKGSYHIYRPNLEREALRQENVRLTEEIVSALNERRVAVAYEPVVAIGSRQPVFYECLMRVKRQDGTIVSAGDIVPSAERLGLVRLIDHRMLELVVAELTAHPGLRTSINVSPDSTTDPDWWNGLNAMLRRHPGIAERLTVEITETVAIHDVDTTRGFVARVKELGCRIAIDDFGAGFTSFRNLRKLGVDIVKIDGDFVQRMRSSEDDRAFVHTLLDLAKRLGLETVAERVKDEATAAMLATFGCDYIQGELVGLATLTHPLRDSVRESA
jgi:diguanylate cyclase (GGDEF)-like protein